MRRLCGAGRLVAPICVVNKRNRIQKVQQVRRAPCGARGENDSGGMRGEKIALAATVLGLLAGGEGEGMVVCVCVGAGRWDYWSGGCLSAWLAA